MSELAGWLGSLDKPALARVIESRADVLVSPHPDSLDELADRLTDPYSMAAALLALPAPAVQVVEVMVVLGERTTRHDLAAMLDVPAQDEHLTQVLGLLSDLALVWPGGGNLCLAPLRQMWPDALHLGPPAADLLARCAMYELRRMADALGVPGGRRKQDVIAAVAGRLADGDSVRTLAATAPAATRRVLDRATWHGPYIRSAGILLVSAPSAPERWALDRGLLVNGDDWGQPMMPREVALALRGEDYHPPFEPLPPALPTSAVPVESVEYRSAEAAANVVTRVEGLLDACSHRPAATLKAGGVGTRELNRLARTLDDTADHVRLWLELASAAGLIETTDAGAVPTPAYDAWSTAQPPQRLATLLAGWTTIACAVLYPPPPDEPPRPALTWPADGQLAAGVRGALLATAGSFPEGDGADVEDIVEHCAWRCPLIAGQVDDYPALARALWKELELLGLVVDGAGSNLGRALAGGDTALAAAERLLPAAQATAILQADLTAVVTGAPAVRLTAVLDLAADRESRGTASTWRFSPQSVRRALDAGHTADDLIAALRSAATTSTVPQPLEYLIADVARRHGAIGVRDVASIVCCDDEALLAEVLHARKLAHLGLTALAPTVLGSARPAADTLAALRSAGYSPTGRRPDGTPVLEPVARHRTGSAGSPDRRAGTANPPAGDTAPDPAALAAALLAAGPGTSAGRSAAFTRIRDAAPHLNAAETRLLAHAVDHGTPVYIDYVNAQGNPSSRVIEAATLAGDMLHGWCRLREDERMFTLRRIQHVSPVIAARA